ncbi:MAG: nitrogen fixation protein NifZ [Methylotenera sp.]|nr:nitrogen fixation protein NifZ [Methylotenera sp.]
MRPRFEYGEEVRVIRNVRNDGTFPGTEIGDLLIKRGSIGYVQNIGTFLQDQLIYAVHFLENNVVVGCREEELLPSDAMWVQTRFDFREKVSAKIPLGMAGNVLVPQGEIGQVMKVFRDDPQNITYHIYFAVCDKTLQVPEGALDDAPAEVIAAELLAESSEEPAE